MTVHRLSLSGLTDDEADQEVQALFAHPRLERVLVDDDVSMVAKHRTAYQRIIMGNRVWALLCVLVGPRADSDGKLRLPDFLAGVQGYGVLWVGDPAGVDWRPAAVPVANGHVGDTDGLARLVELLETDEIFDRVHLAFEDGVQDRVACPGLHLAATTDEAATFTAALGVAIERLCGAGSGSEQAFLALLPEATGNASLDDGGPIAQLRDEVTRHADRAAKAVAEAAGLRGRLRRGDKSLQGHLVELRAALADLRGLGTKLLQDASTLGQLTENQHRLVKRAGIRFDGATSGSAPAPAPNTGTDRSLITRAITDSVKGGDTLTLVIRRLARTEREVGRRGSATYLPEVEKACPAGLLSRLADLTSPDSGNVSGATETARLAGVNDAKKSAQALVDLLIRVANREWSPAVSTAEDIAGARVALDGIGAALKEQATQAGQGPGRARGARLAKLGDALLPVLRDLVLRCVADEAAKPSTGGQEVFQAAHRRAKALLAEWLTEVRKDGVTATPPFATSSLHAQLDIEDDVTEDKEALLYPPNGEMWQLCAAGDIRIFDSQAAPQVVRFASRLNKEALAGTRASGEIEWTKSGRYAGMMRLVPLQHRFIGMSDTSSPASSAPGTQ